MKTILAYKKQKITYSITNSCISPYSYLVLNDAPSSKSNNESFKENFSQYICDSIEILKEHIDSLNMIDVPLSESKEKRIRKLLENVIEAKHIWSEEYISKNGVGAVCRNVIKGNNI